MENQAVIMISVAILGVSDPLAAVVGRRYGRTELVNGRSLQGSLTFLGSGVLVSGVLLRLVQPNLSIQDVLFASVCSSLLAALAELFSKKIDDNLSIPLAAALGLWSALYVAGSLSLL